ncbi:hypothetical protein [Maricaulis sp. MIT060901]|uniref:hypothetical protein n=1 Tax=Maricaulis sp. MIT060901 TaxID=3096993 RepID=UPI0039998684
MDANLKQDLQGGSPLVFGAIEIVLPADTVRLSTGLPVTIEGQPFTPKHTVYGSLGRVEGIEDGIGDTVPAPTVEMLTGSDAGIVNLSTAAAQGSRVRLWFGSINRVSGLAVGIQQVFTGILDTAELDPHATGKSLKLQLLTTLALALEPKDHRRCSDSFHQSVWPGERGMRRRSDLRRKFAWRTNQPGAKYTYSSDGSATSGRTPGGRGRISI